MLLGPRLLPCACLLAALACTRKVDEAPPSVDAAPKVEPEQNAEPAPKPKPEPKAQQWSEPAREHLLLLAHDDAAPEGSVRAIALADGLSPLAAEPVPAMPRPNWPKHHMVVAAHGGAGRFAVAGGNAAPWQIELRELGDPAPLARVELGERQPAALSMIGDRLFVGAGDSVMLIDFAAAKPDGQLLHKRPEMKFKAYDLFARDGEWLIAIDDVVTPIYADSFAIQPPGADHHAGFELPGAINGHYQLALLHGHEGQGTLYVVVDYSIMSGHGHDLAALPLRDGAVDLADDVIINSGGAAAMPVIEEHVFRGPKQPSTLVAGEQFTPWTGLARVPGPDGKPGTLLVAAGSRGLLRFPDDFGSDTKAELLELDAPCLDVLAEGSRVWVLLGSAGKGGSAVVELAPGLEPRGRVDLDEVYARFVH